jgi:hypothetical protein
MGSIDNGRGRVLVIEEDDDCLEISIETPDGDGAGIVFSSPQQIIDVFHEFVTVLREMGAEINLTFKQVQVMENYESREK